MSIHQFGIIFDYNKLKYDENRNMMKINRNMRKTEI